MKKYQLFFLLALACIPTSPSFAATISCPQTYSLLGDAGPNLSSWEGLYPGEPFAKILDEGAKGSLPRQAAVEAILEQAENGFAKNGGKFTKINTADGSIALLITPISKVEDLSSHPLNILASGLKKYGKVELIYNPSRISLQTDGTRAYAQMGNGFTSLNIGHLAAHHADPKDAFLVHEIIHAKNYFDELRGKSNAFHSLAIAAEPSSFGLSKRKGLIPPIEGGLGRGYNEVMKQDELITFRFNLRKA